MQSIASEILGGKTDAHLAVEGEYSGKLHSHVVEPFVRMRDAASSDGIELCIASSFRNFDRQLYIWNAKARGERPIQNEQGEVLDISSLSEVELMHAILRWSALPGASRHHWGTDMDVYDAAALDKGAVPGLLVAEYLEGGPFASLNAWMETNLSRFDFSRPYQRDRGGIAPEPWHISYQPVARQFESELSPEYLARILADSDLELKETVLQNLKEIFERYIQIT